MFDMITTFGIHQIAMQAVVGAMKFEEEGLLLELLIAVCLLSTGDFELQRLFRKSGLRALFLVCTSLVPTRNSFPLCVNMGLNKRRYHSLGWLHELKDNICGSERDGI